jgi:hypothetical protein
MKITYAVTVCNEFIEIQQLIAFLLKHKRLQDEIVVQMDLNLGDINNQTEDKNQVFAYLMKHQEQGHIRVIFYPLNNDFAQFKNHLTDQCTGDYIFQIDADEMINEYICRLLPQVLEANQVDVIRVPRINTVNGLTTEHIQRWQWNVNEKGHVNFPDYQWRIYRNTPEIRWENKVHEILIGYKTISHLPIDTEFCLIHEKTIERQERQNNYYDTL